MRLMLTTLFIVLVAASAANAGFATATGGNITNTPGYRIHTFTNSGVFSVSAGGDIEVLVVGGGGSGGNNGGGGGGAGGLVHSNAFPVVASNYTVTVGDGAGVITPYDSSWTTSNGMDSAFGSLIAKGGGGGSSRDYGPPGATGGSGGGGGGATTISRYVAGSGTIGQGNSGGNGVWPNTGVDSAGGGGGGAGEPGTEGTHQLGGNGGIGLEFTNFAVVAGSPAGWFAGGGAGGRVVNGINGTGGKGGGGDAAVSGVANTGGGGGGGGNGAGGPNTGGSGIVIVRYAVRVDLPYVNNANGATNVTTTGAYLNGALSSTGTSATTAFVYWGETDGGTNTTQWANTNIFPAPQNIGPLTHNVTLLSDKEYVYRYAASNNSGLVWADASEYLLTAGISVSVDPNTINETGETATFRFARSLSVTSRAITVYYETGGDAVSGIDYEPLTANNVTIAAGDTNTTVPIISKPNYQSGSDKELKLTVLDGRNYAVGSSSNAILNITNLDFISSATSGVWDAGTTWLGGMAPGSGDDVVITNGCTVTILTNTAISIKSLLVKSGGMLTHQANSTTALGERYKVVLDIANTLTVESGGQINVDGKGYAAKNGPGVGPNISGGSYGGMGCPHAHTGNLLPGPTYGSIIAPTNLGSGGNNKAAGGAIQISVGGASTIDGVLSAGGAPNPDGELSGSGGSVFLTTGQLTGNGILKAHGGEAPSYGGNSGGGGRVAVVLTDSTDTGDIQMQAYATTGRSGGTGSGGTVYVETTNHASGQGRLIVDYNDIPPWNRTLGVTEQNGLETSSYAFSEIILTNGGVYALDSSDTLDITSTVVSGDPTVRFDGIHLKGGTLIIPPALSWTHYFITVGTTNTPFNPSSVTVGTNATLKIDVPWTITFPLTLEAGGWLSHSANSDDEAYKLNLTFNGDLDIPPGAQINVEGMGYRAASGPGKGSDAGGYGGMGGNRNGNGGTTYGSITAPTNLGSGGNSGAGGGAVKLTVAGTATVDGIISAANAASTVTSSGSGGAVYLKAGAVQGSGTIRANSVNTSGNTSTGGGGRIAVILTNASDFADLTLQAYAGSGSSGYSGIGGAGTLYLQTADQGPGEGTLLIDANNHYWSTTAWLGQTLIGSNITDTEVGTVIITNQAILELTNQALTVNGSWLNAATFAAQSNSTVNLASTHAARVTGNNAFYNLSAGTVGKTIRFEAGKTNTVNGTLTFGDGTTLLSTEDGIQWWLNLSTSTGTQDVGGVTVKDSNASLGQLMLAGTGSMDLKNNENWLIPARGSVFIVR